MQDVDLDDLVLEAVVVDVVVLLVGACLFLAECRFLAVPHPDLRHQDLSLSLCLQFFLLLRCCCERHQFIFALLGFLEAFVPGVLPVFGQPPSMVELL